MRGSKRKLREGVWELRLSLGREPVTGSYRRLSKTFHGSARQADEALRDLIDELAPNREAVGSTFGQLLDAWLGECERLELSPTTLRNYRAVVESTIRPRLGAGTLNSLTARHLDELYGAMRSAGKAPKTIRNYHAIISAALHQGVRWGWARRNVAELAKAPWVSTRRVEAPSVEVVRKVIDGAEERDPRQARSLCSRRSRACAGASCAPSSARRSTSTRASSR